MCLEYLGCVGVKWESDASVVTGTMSCRRRKEWERLEKGGICTQCPEVNFTPSHAREEAHFLAV